MTQLYGLASNMPEATSETGDNVKSGERKKKKSRGEEKSIVTKEEEGVKSKAGNEEGETKKLRKKKRSRVSTAIQPKDMTIPIVTIEHATPSPRPPFRHDENNNEEDDEFEDDDDEYDDDEDVEEVEEEQEEEEEEMTLEEKKDMYEAVKSGDIDLLEDCLDKPNSDINMTWYRENLLMTAIRHSHQEMAEFLLDNGIDRSFTASIVALKDTPNGKILDRYELTCRQMAYDHEMLGIVQLIDFMDGKLFPFIRPTERTPRYRRPKPSEVSDSDLSDSDTDSDSDDSSSSDGASGGRRHVKSDGSVSDTEGSANVKMEQIKNRKKRRTKKRTRKVGCASDAVSPLVERLALIRDDVDGENVDGDTNDATDIVEAVNNVAEVMESADPADDPLGGDVENDYSEVDGKDTRDLEEKDKAEAERLSKLKEKEEKKRKKREKKERRRKKREEKKKKEEAQEDAEDGEKDKTIATVSGFDVDSGHHSMGSSKLRIALLKEHDRLSERDENAHTSEDTATPRRASERSGAGKSSGREHSQSQTRSQSGRSEAGGSHVNDEGYCSVSGKSMAPSCPPSPEMKPAWALPPTNRIQSTKSALSVRKARGLTDSHHRSHSTSGTVRNFIRDRPLEWKKVSGIGTYTRESQQWHTSNNDVDPDDVCVEISEIRFSPPSSAQSIVSSSGSLNPSLPRSILKRHTSLSSIASASEKSLIVSPAGACESSTRTKADAKPEKPIASYMRPTRSTLTKKRLNPNFVSSYGGLEFLRNPEIKSGPMYGSSSSLIPVTLSSSVIHKQNPRLSQISSFGTVGNHRIPLMSGDVQLPQKRNHAAISYRS